MLRLFKPFALVGALLGTAFLNGCAVNPVTGERDFSLVTPEQEVAIGQQQYIPSQQQQGGRYVVDPDLHVYMNEIVQNLAQVSGRPGLPYEIVVLNSGVPNAWALPGGKMAINRGLLLEMEDEAQLAAVLGHEIVHAAARHGAKQMSQAQLLGATVQIAGVAANGTGYGQLASAGASLGAQAWQAHYSRGDELEADKYGIQYMHALGYSAQGAVELQETFVRLSQGKGASGLDAFFSSHPPSQQRVEANQKMANQLPGGARNKSRYQQAIAQLKKDKPAYDAYDKAVKAAQVEDYKTASAELNKAIKHQPKENQFWILKGQIEGKQKQSDAAIASFTKAINANPEYFVGHLYRGVLHQQGGKNTQAEKDLTAANKLLATQAGVFYLAEAQFGLNKKDKAIVNYRAVAGSGGELGHKAQQRLGSLGAQ